MVFDFINLNVILKEPYIIYAHTCDGKNQINTNEYMNKHENINKHENMNKHLSSCEDGVYECKAVIDNKFKDETLQEHTALCEYYFKELYKIKRFDVFFENLLKEFFVDLSKDCRDLFFKMLCNTITFHDTGKINPSFQRSVMNKEIPRSYKANWLSGKKHSMFSACIYLNHFIPIINQCEFSKEDKIMLKGFCMINAFVIAKHHSNIGYISTFLDEFNGGIGSSIFGGLLNDNSYVHDEIYIKSKGFINMWSKFTSSKSIENETAIYTYCRFVYSVLAACDYYATTGYKTGFCINEFGIADEKYPFKKLYEETSFVKDIRSKEFNKQKIMNDPNFEKMLQLRNKIFFEAENSMLENLSAGVYFLEAPTGSGKSNTAMNLSFQLLDRGYDKIYYVYPFNALVEQNIMTLKDTFGEKSDIFQKIAVINSNTPIKIDKNLDSETIDMNYEKALLDRQFLNYPFILTTHVSLFQTMFDENREALFGFSQLINSVIVFDEIQSYKNTIWSEIIIFLKAFSKLLNIKVIIMSATLPNLNYLTDRGSEAVPLLKNRDAYFLDPVFKDRVKISYELLHREINLDYLKEHVLGHFKRNEIGSSKKGSKKILIEFIKKSTAYEFWELLSKDSEISVPLYFISGDDNRADREKILMEVKKENQDLILIATQVIEAGVDIDMDIGYKDISKLDSEEQFLGRFNRSYKRDGIVYFFDLDDAKKIYNDGDYRINKEFTLLNEDMKSILKDKDFDRYYKMIMEHLKSGFNASMDENKNLSEFFKESVQKLNFPNVSARMKLINDSDWDMSVYLTYNRVIDDEDLDDGVLNGEDIWNAYKGLLHNHVMGYSEKQYKLSKVRSKMNYFIYRIKKNPDLMYSDKIGELYKIENGEEYFVDGKLDKEKLERVGGLFLDLG